MRAALYVWYVEYLFEHPELLLRCPHIGCVTSGVIHCLLITDQQTCNKIMSERVPWLSECRARTCDLCAHVRAQVTESRHVADA
jgi:hypothetical protein